MLHRRRRDDHPHQEREEIRPSGELSETVGDRLGRRSDEYHQSDLWRSEQRQSRSHSEHTDTSVWRGVAERQGEKELEAKSNFVDKKIGKVIEGSELGQIA